MHFAVFVLHSSLILHCLQLKSHRRYRKNILLLLHVQISVIDRSEICVCFLSNLIPANFSFLSSASADVALPPGEKLEGREGIAMASEADGRGQPHFLVSSSSLSSTTMTTTGLAQKRGKRTSRLFAAILSWQIPSFAPSPPAGGEPLPFSHGQNFLQSQN